MGNYALFPFGQIKPKSRVIIYGAGLAGKNMYMQIRKTGYCDVVCVVDRNYKEKEMYEVPVYAPDFLADFHDYDYIVISIMDEKIKKQIERTLIEEIKIDKEKLVVPINNIICWEYCFSDLEDEIKFAERFPSYLKKVSPRKLITSKRIDVAIRFLLFRDFINDFEGKENLSLFKRYTMIRTGGVEWETLHSPVGKETIDEYVSSGRELCRSMQLNGFTKEGLIPINERKEPLDGLHRIAAAIALDEDVYVHEFAGIEQRHVDFSYFKDNGFTWEDRVRILRGFTEIYDGDMGCLVLFYPCHDLWEYIEKKAGELFEVVGTLDYCFENNYVGFENVVREMYFDPMCKNEMIQRKLEMLKYDRLEIRFILLSDEKRARDDFYEQLRSFKLEIREKFYEEFEEVPIIVHSPDTKDEFFHLKNIFLSPNNIKWMNRKICQKYRSKFINMLTELNKWCIENQIDRNDIVIVGSAPMEVFGLKECGDIDFTLMKDLRKRFVGDESFAINESLEIVHRNYARDESLNVIPDEVIICDDNHYFYFWGFKFVNLNYVREKKALSGRPKDLADIRAIDLFMKWDEVFDDKQALRNRIHEEMLRRKY